MLVFITRQNFQSIKIFESKTRTFTSVPLWDTIAALPTKKIFVMDKHSRLLCQSINDEEKVLNNTNNETI
jgi:hypothetical protein